MTVKHEHPDYKEMRDRWQMCRDACAGEYAVHKRTVTYLPKLTNEESVSYDLRLKMTPFFNATWRTVAGLKGMLFRKPPKINIPDKLKPFADNIDAAGTDLVSFCNECAEEALIVGRVGLMVDYPEAPENITLEDAAKLNLRPMVSLYKAETIINWRTKNINGSKLLSLVVLTEQAEVQDKDDADDDEFDIDYETQYRVLDLVNGQYRQRLYRIAKNNLGVEYDELISEYYPTMNGKAMDFIPFVFVGVDCCDSDVDVPPLMDLITTNFKHYGQATSYERGCFISGLPTLFTFGYNPQPGESIYIGGTVSNNLPDSNARAEFVEVTSQFGALRTNLEDKKIEMAVLGARMLEPSRSGGQVEAAETVARRNNGEESLLSDMSQTLSRGIEKAVNWLAMWAGVDGECEIDLNRDFLPTQMDSGTLTAMVGAWQAGAFSVQTLYDNLVKGEIISDNISFEEEQERINSQQPMLAASAMQAETKTVRDGQN
jgi:hypothetical protein